ncbi:hypothetical protein SAMN04489724_2360 [Algoriphagus locisalis]|uniref:Uncharacterized protein n=1 Tax=Algoriphagus locisalis TaxID=305507 RepID=A0A1I7BEV1_9BACT|nr:hypothetical protein [Algoriphagus locisalis]SFT85729.1 hypothetical protein SAMN04489724_2360 [Algoriphagus locisalis]
MKRLLYILFTLISLPCLADQPKENLRNEIHLHKKGITIINLPYSRYSEFGKVEVINNSDSSILYTLDFFLRFENYFSEDATYHVQINDWFLVDYSNKVAITFYEKGKVINSLKFDDLNIQMMNLKETVSHIVWEYESFLHDNYFYVLTTNNELLVFDITRGELFQHEKNTSSGEFETLKKKSDSYSISYSDYSPSIDTYRTNQNQDLDLILSNLVFKYFPDSTELVWIGVYVFRNGSLTVTKVESINGLSLDDKTIEAISSEIKKVRLTDIDFPEEYYKWGKMIKLEKEKN